MKAEKTLLLVFPRKQSVDMLTTRMALDVSTHFYLLTGYHQQSVDNPHGCKRVNTSTRVFKGNRKKNFFHASHLLRRHYDGTGKEGF
jgi:hypothetical protein